MRESGEPMEFGIFDYYKVFSKAFGEEEGAVGLEWKRGDVIKLPTAELWGISCHRLLRVALTIACPNRSRAAGYND